MRAGRAAIHGGEVPGHERHGGSSLQSVLRGAEDIETDFLNGEIVLLGRLHGIPTPANAVVQAVGNALVGAQARGRTAVGNLTVAELKRRLDEARGRESAAQS